MTAELWQRLKPLFHAALERNAEDRAAFISMACGGDTELRSHLKKLLDAEAQSTGSLAGPLAAVADFFPESTTRFQAEEMVLGRFRVVRLIGRGGMGEVYEAEDLQLGRIALKTVRREIALSTGAFERFRQEVLLARKITGPQVCRIHELFLLPASDGHEATVFLTMEYLDGVTLAARLATDGPIPWREALRMAQDLCEGLRLIHGEGIIHRDLKSGNIMLCSHSARTVLMDFGLAQGFEAEGSGSHGPSIATDGVAMAPRIVGTPEYMAPEQFEGGSVSPATDIYALGIVLYEMVTGVHPYAGPTPIAAAIRRARHPASPSTVGAKVPPQWDRVIERCLEYEPAKRFQSAGEVAQALRPGFANLRYMHRDRPWVFRAVCLLALAAVVWGGFHLWQTRHYYRPSAEARRWYDSGVAALREGSYVKATRSLQAALNDEPRYVMAHARLAEAWADLDFQGNAQQEMLIAVPDARRLAPLDRMYMEAIQATITRDNPRGVEIYKRILNHLPPQDKAAGYVDLGMAYERAGDPTHALENYAQAAKLDTDNPASFLHTAVVQSHLHHVSEANQSFERAEKLFTAEMNQEGLAELDYARGYAANDGGNRPEAKQYLERSLDEAKKIPSVQLQIRTLTQLSVVAYNTDAFPHAEQYADQAIRLARENQLDAWAANGLVMLANAQIVEGKLQQAEETLQEALKLAHQTEQPRWEAMANLTLASLMNQKQLPDEVIGPAQAALDYYKKVGRVGNAAKASLLLIRAQRDKGQYQQALQAGNEVLALATRSGVRDQKRQAEELIGSVLHKKEQYPDALLHFRNAASLVDTASDRAWEAVWAAIQLWKLGRYEESDAMLQIGPVNGMLATFAGEARTASLLSRGRYREALALARQMPERYPKMRSVDQQEFERDRAIAESHLGMTRQALSDLDDLEKREKTGQFGEEAIKNLAIAEVSLFSGLPQQAHDAAVQAAAHYASIGQLDSELHSVCLAAAASKLLKDHTAYSAFSTKAVDIISQIRHTWSPQESQTYFSRPDLQLLMREVPAAANLIRRPS
jgi:tetratricopeptide (TPR) repeat protein